METGARRGHGRTGGARFRDPLRAVLLRPVPAQVAGRPAGGGPGWCRGLRDRDVGKGPGAPSAVQRRSGRRPGFCPRRAGDPFVDARPAFELFGEGLQGEPLVGQAAARMRAIDPGSTIYSIKRFIGLRGRDVRNEDVDVDYRLTRHRGAPLRVQISALEYAPEEISAFVLRKLKRDAENALGRSISRAVITVPAYFNDAQRTATKKAGDLAGFLVDRIVNEPTAAALAYGLDRSQSKSRIAVYDLGGGTFDISILELKEGIFEVLATNGNTRLGGDDIDNALCRSIVARFCEGPSWKHSAAETTALQRLREGIVDAKHRLSIEEKIGIEIPFFDGAKTLPIELSRKELENIARPTIERTRLHCLRALADAISLYQSEINFQLGIEVT